MQWFVANHDLLMVVLSYAVSVVGAMVSLHVADYIVDGRGRLRYGWLLLAAVVFGGCAIWAMHFVGMMAYEMAMPATYDIAMTMGSLALPIALSALGFFVAYRWRDSLTAWLAAGMVFGSGVAAMHYLGMSALRTSALMTHDNTLVAVSIGIAVVAATAALRIVVHWSGTKRMLSPLIMGLAVCGMHYVGMAAMDMSSASGAAGSIDYFDGAWTQEFMGFTAGLAVFLTLLVGSALVMFRKALDIEPEFAAA